MGRSIEQNKKIVNVLLWILLIFIMVTIALNWYSLILAMEHKKNFHPQKFEYNKGKNYFPKTN